MATRVAFENSNDIGVFAKLTNGYCLTALGASENFYRWPYFCRPALSKFCGCTSTRRLPLTKQHAACSVFEAELADHIPVVKTSVAGTRLVGRVTVGAMRQRAATGVELTHVGMLPLRGRVASAELCACALHICQGRTGVRPAC